MKSVLMLQALVYSHWSEDPVGTSMMLKPNFAICLFNCVVFWPSPVTPDPSASCASIMKSSANQMVAEN